MGSDREYDGLEEFEKYIQFPDGLSKDPCPRCGFPNSREELVGFFGKNSGGYLCACHTCDAVTFKWTRRGPGADRKEQCDVRGAETKQTDAKNTTTVRVCDVGSGLFISLSQPISRLWTKLGRRDRM